MQDIMTFQGSFLGAFGPVNIKQFRPYRPSWRFEGQARLKPPPVIPGLDQRHGGLIIHNISLLCTAD